MNLHAFLKTEQTTFKVFMFYRKTFDNGYTMDVHRHEPLEIMYVIDGEMTVNFFASEWQQVPVRKGQFVLIDSDVEHNISLAKKCRIVNVEFKIAESSSGFPMQRMLTSIPLFVSFVRNLNRVCVLSDTGSILSDLIKLQSVSAEQLTEPENHYLFYSRTFDIFISIAKLASRGKYNTSSKHVNKVIALIQNNFEKQLTISSIAATVGVNPFYLQRLFKEHTDNTINGYITQLRVDLAKNLLTSSNLKIIDICMESGFNTRQNFTTAFKKLTEQSPEQYRHEEKIKIQHFSVTKPDDDTTQWYYKKDEDNENEG